MGRLVTYLLVIVGGLAFWISELLLNYNDYVGNSPFALEEQYQVRFLFQRSHLLLAELAFPVLMVISFLTLLIFKFAARQVRLALGFVLLLSTEFWVWRSFFFDGRMATLFLQSEAQDPNLMLPNDFKQYLIGFGLALALVIFLREYPLGQDTDALHARLRRSLRNKDYVD